MKAIITLLFLTAIFFFCLIWYGNGYRETVSKIGRGDLKPEVIVTTNFVYKAVSTVEKP